MQKNKYTSDRKTLLVEFAETIVDNGLKSKRIKREKRRDKVEGERRRQSNIEQGGVCV